jgi:hypothetical protein
MKKRAIYFLVFALSLLLLWGGFFSGRLLTTTYYCLFLPHREWKIELPQPGQLNISLVDNQQLKVLRSRAFNMDRPDYFSFKLSPLLEHGTKVTVGDTIGWVQFYSDDLALLRHQIELQLAQSQLRVLSTGDKEAIQKEYRKNYEYALAKLRTFEKTYARKKALFEQKLISAEEWEQIAGEYEVLKLAADRAKAQLESVASGAKPEEVEWVRQKIASIRKQLQMIQAKKQQQVLTAPFPGTFLIAANATSAYLVADTDTVIAKFYVDDNDLASVPPGKQITIRLLPARKEITATIVYRGGYPTSFNGRLKYLVLAMTDNRAGEIEVFSKGAIKIPQKLTLF